MRNDGTRADTSASITATMRSSMVGTTVAWVTPSRWTVAIHSSAVNRGSGTMRRPIQVELRTDATPAMWNGGTDTIAASSSPALNGSIVFIT